MLVWYIYMYMSISDKGLIIFCTYRDCTERMTFLSVSLRCSCSTLQQLYLRRTEVDFSIPISLRHTVLLHYLSIAIPVLRAMFPWYYLKLPYPSSACTWIRLLVATEFSPLLGWLLGTGCASVVHRYNLRLSISFKSLWSTWKGFKKSQKALQAT